MAEETIIENGADDETVIVPPQSDTESDANGPTVITPDSGETVVVNNIQAGDEADEEEDEEAV